MPVASLTIGEPEPSRLHHITDLRTTHISASCPHQHDRLWSAVRQDSGHPRSRNDRPDPKRLTVQRAQLFLNGRNNQHCNTQGASTIANKCK